MSCAGVEYGSKMEGVGEGAVDANDDPAAKRTKRTSRLKAAARRSNRAGRFGRNADFLASQFANREYIGPRTGDRMTKAKV